MEGCILKGEGFFSKQDEDDEVQNGESLAQVVVERMVKEKRMKRALREEMVNVGKAISRVF